ncbi:MAG TPA: ABC transporter ATP-binding protein [Vicinamibacteria bacterium]|nr:ABC transporter ATP-binding protein [Vicinamibacteria bacterium]
MLRIERVTKRWRGGKTAVEDFTLEVPAGVLGLLGPNGAGKTTLMQMIATLTRPTSGRVLFQGRDVARAPEAIRERLGYLPQDFGVYDNLTAFEFLDYVARLKGVRSRARVEGLLESVNLHTVARRNVGTFSGGMRQRLGIAQALLADPELLIVDEPTAGLDPEERVRFRSLLSELGLGRLVILSTHIVSDVESIATHVAVMRAGRLAAFGTAEQLLREARGSAWEATLASEDLAARRSALVLSSAVRHADGVHVRLVGPAPPVPGARPVEPTLEDAYLFLIRRDAAAPPVEP